MTAENRQPTEMELRVAAARATLERFKDRPLKLGTNDCARMCAFHLRKLGHKVKLPPSGSYRSTRSGAKALAAMGYETLAAAIDGFGFERIPPAAAVAGDIIELPGEGELGALSIAVGNGRVVGYHQDIAGAAVLQPVEWVAAWRVRPAAVSAQ